jgi:GntR family transcriptional repressor for pyruvate dehydrogenase complex
MDKSTLYQPVGAGKGTLSEQVAYQIRDLIARHQLVAGDRLPPTDELTGYLQVSRTAVREAIKLLDAWGIVRVRHGVGTFVAEPGRDALRVPIQLSAERSRSAIRNLLQVREALEPDIAAIAARNASPENIREIEETLREMDLTLDDPAKYIQADLSFHSALAEATGNDLFLILIYPINDLLQDIMGLVQRTPGAMRRAQTYHWELVDHIKAGPDHAAQAKETMLRHLAQVRSDIEPQLENDA